MEEQESVITLSIDDLNTFTEPAQAFALDLDALMKKHDVQLVCEFLESEVRDSKDYKEMSDAIDVRFVSKTETEVGKAISVGW